MSTRWRRQIRPIITCSECKKEKSSVAFGLCRACYLRMWRRARPSRGCIRCGVGLPFAGQAKLCVDCRTATRWATT